MDPVKGGVSDADGGASTEEDGVGDKKVIKKIDHVRDSEVVRKNPLSLLSNKHQRIARSLGEWARFEPWFHCQMGSQSKGCPQRGSERPV